MPYDNSNSIALWKNEDKREGKNDAEYRGQGEVNGILYWADAWVNVGKKDGRKFLSVKLKPKETGAKAPNKSAPVKAEAKGFDDDIPW